MPGTRWPRSDDPDALQDRIAALPGLQRHEDAIADCDRALRLRDDRAFSMMHEQRGRGLPPAPIAVPA
jgi:hypothetical protein